MLRISHSLISLGIVDEVLIIAIGEKNLPREENISSQIKVQRINLLADQIPFSMVKKIFKLFEFNIRAFLLSRKYPSSHTACHSLLVLPLGIILKFFRFTEEVIYEAHELETERNGLSGIPQYISRLVEKVLVKYVKHITVVSPSIERWYRDTYKIEKVTLLRNIPLKEDRVFEHNLLREKVGVSSDDVVCLYQGVLGKGRGIETLLEVFSELSIKQHLVFLGYGPLLPLIQKYKKSCLRIHVLEAVSPKELLSYTCGADIGLCLIQNTCLSYYYCLPNKLFEYIHAGVPVIASDFPDMKSVIKEYGCGWTIDQSTDTLKNLLSGMSKSDVESRKKATERAKINFSWQQEEGKLKTVYL